MKVLIVYPGIIPATHYGGTERVIWYLGQELKQLGHQVTYLVKEGSQCDFARIKYMEQGKSWNDQIPPDVDIVHFNFQPEEPISKPYLVTIHGNFNDHRKFDINTVFVSKSHAQVHGSTSFVYNGLNWNDYSKPEWNNKRSYFHFLGNAAWRIKNVKGAISIASKIHQPLYVLGGSRLNLRMGFRFTLNPSVKFFSRVGGTVKDNLVKGSKALLFPVRWHEPFGLAIIESLYFGCPVFGTPYGSLVELIPVQAGLLSDDSNELAQAASQADDYDRKWCYEYAAENFNSAQMTINYIARYEKILNGEKLNQKNPQRVTLQQEKFLPFQ